MKTQIWSPDELTKQGEFVTFAKVDPNSLPRFDGPAEPAAPLVFDSVAKPETDSAEDIFSMAPGYWDALLEDRLFRARFDEMVNREVERRVTTEIERRFQELTPKVTAEAHQKGYDAGYSEAKAKGEQEVAAKMIEIADKMTQMEKELGDDYAEKRRLLENESQARRKVFDTIVEVWKADRQILMHQHEESWLTAMTHLLKRFQIEKAGSLSKALQAWLTQTLPEALETDQVRLSVSPAEFESVQGALAGEASPNRWKVVVDESLSPGQYRYEVGAGGVIFDAEHSYQKVMDWVSKE